jgi:hypothetical protein
VYREPWLLQHRTLVTRTSRLYSKPCANTRKLLLETDISL